MSKLIIFGTGDIAQIANYYFETDSEYEVCGFTVDSAYMNGDSFEGKPVINFEKIQGVYNPAEYYMFIATSYANLNKVREAKYHEAKGKGYKLATYVSSRCSYLSQFPCGDNCFIFEDNTVQPFAKIGNNVTLWSGNHIGHHSVIDNHNFISSHVVISGHCHIKSNCFLGVNATLHNNVTIEKQNIIAAGAIISKSTHENEVWVPARSMKIDKSSSEINL